jgi:hypothetical protein
MFLSDLSILANHFGGHEIPHRCSKPGYFRRAAAQLRIYADESRCTAVSWQLVAMNGIASSLGCVSQPMG